MTEWLITALPIIMLGTLPLLLLTGYPVAFVLAGTGVLFAAIGMVLGEFPLIGIFNVPLRVWGSLNGNLVYPAVPILLFMGVALEKSGVAKELLECLQRLLRWVPGNLAVSMTLMGIILAPAAGLVGASVVTLAFIGLPVMLSQGYRASIATGSIAAAGTLGIILPPGVMLFFLAELFRVPIAAMFVATVIPVLALAGMFIIIVAASIFSYPFNYFGGPDLIRDFLLGLELGDFGMLIVILAITFVLGFFIDWIEVFVVALPIYLPILKAMDFATHTGSPDLSKVWIATLFALVLQTSFLTPPFGFSLFFVKGAAPPSVRISEIYRGVAPMVVIQLLMIAAVLIWPIIALGPASKVLLP